MITICDVGPRDGLQNDPVTLDAPTRSELARRLADAGVRRVEVASFVSERHVPQMRDAEAVVAGLPDEAGAEWTALVLNERGYERASGTGLRRLNLTIGATESFCRRNQGIGRDAAVELAERLAARAAADGVRLTLTLAVAFGCPFEGRVAPVVVERLADRLRGAGVGELVLADTIGVAVPSQVGELARRVAPEGCHFHDTRNTGVANALAALEHGVRLLDASIGGTGGCPFAPGATGNVATEDLVYVLDGMGVETGIDLARLLDASAWLAARLGRRLPGAVHRAGGFALHG